MVPTVQRFATPPPRHLLLALAVVAVWGTNFVVIKLALAALPPLLLAALRFALAWLPAALLIRPPAVPWRDLMAYGLLIGAGQFGLLYLAMNRDITPGLASLVVQTQVFFTIGLAMWSARGARVERPTRIQWIALTLAATGLAVIAAHTDAQTTPLGVGLVLLAALAWASGNSVARRSPQADMLAYVVWSSAFAVPVLLLASFVFEGPQRMADGLRGADATVWLAVAWQAVGNTLFGYAAWGWLLARHPAASIVPMALLVPVFGLAASWWWLGEPLPPWKWAAAALVIGGLSLNLLGPRLARVLR
jgi:O-acetylserine/cysteine efflux transporter